MACGCGGRCGGGGGCSGSVATVTELVSAGVTTDYRGSYDPVRLYRYGDMVKGSDGKNYVYLCKQDSVTVPGTSGSVPAQVVPGTGTVTVPGGYPAVGTGVPKQVPVPSIPHQGRSWRVEGVPALFLDHAVPEYVPSIADNGFLAVFHTDKDQTDPNKEMLDIMDNASMIVSQQDPAHYSYCIDRSTGHIWYYYVNTDTWVDLGGLIGVSDPWAASRYPRHNRVTKVVDRLPDISSAAVSSGDTVLVYHDWIVVTVN